ncbi:MAG: ATP synthase subunit I [Oscillatoriales cyanobacterium SM2_2_1]|nr:ATP synthase subunit I [Oscillatoriales cyanobacterium SM2_2_1]
MAEYAQLKRQLLFTTIVLSLGIAAVVLVTYGTQITLSYFLGAWVGVFYLRMLAKEVDRLNEQGRTSGFRLGFPRLALFVTLMLVAARWNQLHIVPVFLGFLTYKLAILVVGLQDWGTSTSVHPSSNNSLT